MPRFLNTLGRSTLGIGICDRCKFKFSLDELRPDGNIPGLRVCEDCCDEFDPWRLPPNVDDRINLPFTRPDVNIATQPLDDGVIEWTSGTSRITQSEEQRDTDTDDDRTVEDDS